MFASKIRRVFIDLDRCSSPSVARHSIYLLLPLGLRVMVARKRFCEATIALAADGGMSQDLSFLLGRRRAAKASGGLTEFKSF